MNTYLFYVRVLYIKQFLKLKSKTLILFKEEKRQDVNICICFSIIGRITYTVADPQTVN